MMKIWNVWLIFTTFFLTILGTLLTRAGLVASVHAFAQSDIGNWFYGFLGLSVAVCLFFFVKNYSHLKSENKLESLVSRESSFMFNNVMLLASCFVVLWGTLFPILSEAVRGYKITVGAPFFNRVNVPLGLFLLFLTGIGPLLAWRSTSWASVKRNFALPAAFAALVGIALVAFGMRPFTDTGDFYAYVAFVLGGLVTATIASEFLRGGRVLQGKMKVGLLQAMYQLTRRNMRRYGGYVVHFGVVVIVIGLAGTAFNQSQEQEMALHGKLQIGPYTLINQQSTEDDNGNYTARTAIIDVFKNGKLLTTMYPEQRFYKASQQASTIVANHITPQQDLYMIYEGTNPDNGNPIIKVFINPLVVWIWIGVFVVIAGTGIALVPNAAAFKLPSRVALPFMARRRMEPVEVSK